MTQQGDKHERTAPVRRVHPRAGPLRRWMRHVGITACFVVLYLGAFEGLIVVSVLGAALYEEWDRPALCADLPEDELLRDTEADR